MSSIFKSFYNWAISNGYEEGLSIERIDVNGNYSPQNCKWIPRSEQPKNRRCCHFIDVDGEIHTAAEWSRITGLSAETILLRIEKGMSPKAAIEKRATSPKNRKRDEKGRYIGRVNPEFVKNAPELQISPFWGGFWGK